MTSRSILFGLLLTAPALAAAQVSSAVIHVDPAQVTVSAQGATTVILSFVGLNGFVPAEGLWCSKVTATAFGAGPCDPASVYGQAAAAPAGSVSARGVFTDVMSVPASVAQRAFEAALAGQPARFFYVRRFIAGIPTAPVAQRAAGFGAPDQYVVVTCILSASNVNAPFTLTNVRLRLAAETPVLFVRRGERPPPLRAEISYTGSGRLRGRWELVSPGESPPSVNDLLTEGSLTPDARGLQRRFLEIERFNVQLLANGQYTLPGPDPAKLPTSIDGSYTILLRIEASDDPASDTRVGGVVVHNGAAAGFPMPTLRYIVGGGRSRAAVASRAVRLRLPLPGALVPPDQSLTLSWLDDRGAGRYRVEVERIADGKRLLSATVAQGVGKYEVPPFVIADAADGKVRWRVISLDTSGNELGRSEWRSAERGRRP